MTFSYRLFRPFLFSIDAEKAHNFTINALKSSLGPKIRAVQDPSLEVSLFGLKFPNPVGLSAGFDKNAEAIAPCLNMGFGFVEVGTVTPKPQEGNPKPRVWRSARDEAVINRMGFPNAGVDVFKKNLEGFLEVKPRPTGVVGLNIGMNKDQKDPAKDYATLIRKIGPMADYITVNISSPNTPGLRDLQRKEPLTELIEAVRAQLKKSCGDHPPSFLIKLAPDLDQAQQEELSETLLENKIDGIILTNTTLDRPDLLKEKFAENPGGLSGQPLTDKSTEIIRSFYKLTNGDIPIIGVGGISSAAQAYEKIKAGASLVQLYSALVFKGPNVVNGINTGLIHLLEQDGFASIEEAVGADHT